MPNLDVYTCERQILYFINPQIPNISVFPAEYGSLRYFIVNNREILKFRVKFSLDIAKGMENILKNGILYRDLKIADILVTKSNNYDDDGLYIAKICNFGISKFQDFNTCLDNEAYLNQYHLWSPKTLKIRDDIEKTEVFNY